MGLHLSKCHIVETHMLRLNYKPLSHCFPDEKGVDFGIYIGVIFASMFVFCLLVLGVCYIVRKVWLNIHTNISLKTDLLHLNYAQISLRTMRRSVCEYSKLEQHH